MTNTVLIMSLGVEEELKHQTGFFKYQAGWGLLHVRSLDSSLLGFDLLTHPCLASMTPRAEEKANL